jgi:hypothetical protein
MTAERFVAGAWQKEDWVKLDVMGEGDVVWGESMSSELKTGRTVGFVGPAPADDATGRFLPFREGDRER